MNKLKAFVGHSFTQNDENVVRTFLKFFDQIKDMGIGFSWQHAEHAEPKVLAAKVLGLMEGKNLFIGICTKKEVVVAQENIKSGFMQKNTLNVQKEHFLWKTSDWIIQEIGLAKGRGMALILLTECGLRQPGGLLGDLEYIPFDREAPEKAFGKILEMIHALMPKATEPTGEEADIRALPEETPYSEEKNAKRWYVSPKLDWNRDTFEIVLLQAIATDMDKEAQEIYRVYLESEDGKIQENHLSWEAFREYAKLFGGKGGSLTRLQEMAKEHSQNSRIQTCLALGYQEYGEHAKAAQCFSAAAKVSDDAKLQQTSYGDAAVAFARAGKEYESKAALQKMRSLIQNVDDGESIFLQTLRDIAEHLNDNDLVFGVTERLLHLHPEDNDSRFTLAFRYSKADYHDLALFHYLKIPFQERAAAAWNNLGVELDHFHLHNKSVEAYLKAEELGETLAMSNLAQKLIRAGFLKEAEDKCNRAVKIKDYHKNVGYTISRIKDVPEEENQKEKEITAEVTMVYEFYRDYGQALVKECVHEQAGVWECKRCPLNIEIRNGQLSAEGTYEIQNSLVGILGLASGDIGARQPPKPSKYVLRYQGEITGYTVKGSTLIEKVGETKRPVPLLADFEKTNEVLMIFSDDLKEIRVYEKGASKSELFYSIVKR